MKVIAFGHRQRVGKDTAAKFLISYLRTNGSKQLVVRKAGFADKLKSVCYELYKWAGLQPGEFYEDPANAHLKNVVLPLIGKSPRQIWISFGNCVREAVYDGTWYDYLFNHASCDVLVVKDMRFPIEADGILSRGGYVYRIDCPWVDKVDDGADDPLANYERWTGIIQNDSTLKHLHSEVVAIAERLFVRAA